MHHGIDAAFDAPLDLDAFFDDAVADSLDALWLEQEVVIHKGHGPVALFLQVFQLGHNVFSAAIASFAFIEDRNVAENARPGAAARSLHGREFGT